MKRQRPHLEKTAALRRAGRPDIVEGIAVMTHPKNPFRSIWFTRDYGHLSPSPFKAQHISATGVPWDRLALADIAKEMMFRAGGKLLDFQFN